MLGITVDNELGTSLELSSDPRYTIISVSGLNPPTATINTSTVTNFDGSKFNSARVNQRNIVITLCHMEPVETNRIALYTFFKPKHWLKLHFWNGTRHAFIEGYVETMESDYFTNKQQMQISIVCPEPYFKQEGIATNVVASQSIVGMFETNFSLPPEGMEFSEAIASDAIIFDNFGDAESGMIFNLSFVGNCVELTIRNNLNGEEFVVEYEFLAYDFLTINTNKGQKSIILHRNNVEYNLVNYITDDSEWLQSTSGTNSISIEAVYAAENIEAEIVYSVLYEGM